MSTPQESRIRRRLTKFGYLLEKTPARSWTRAHYDVGYMVMDDTRTVRLGCTHRQWDASLDDVQRFADNLT